MMNHQGGECLHAAHAEGILPLFIHAFFPRASGKVSLQHKKEITEDE